MPTIETLRGALDTAELGRTLIHEHIAIRTPGIAENWPDLWDEAACVAGAQDKLGQLWERGVRTVVDLSTADLGRDMDYLQKVAAVTDINVVLCTGIYWIRSNFWRNRPQELLTEVFVREIEEGIAGTGIKAGIIKLASDEQGGGVDRYNEKCLRAGAQAHRQTGVPIATHNGPPTLGAEQQRVFKEEGCDLSRIVIGHVGDTDDTGYLKTLMDSGSYVGMDRFGLDNMLPFEKRCDTVAALCRDGYAEKILLAHDASCCLDWIPDPKAWSEIVPNWHFNHIPDDVIPGLLERGVTEEQIDLMLVGNPRALFEKQGSY